MPSDARSVLLGSVLTLAGTLAGYVVHAGDSYISYRENNQAVLTQHVKEFGDTISQLTPTLIANNSAANTEIALVRLFALIDEVSQSEPYVANSERGQIVSISAAIKNPDVQIWLLTFYSGSTAKASVSANPIAGLAIANAVDQKSTARETDQDTTSNLPSFVTTAVSAKPAQTGWIYLGRGTVSKNLATVCRLNFLHTITEGQAHPVLPCVGMPGIVDVPQVGDTVKMLPDVNLRSGPPTKSGLAPIVAVLKSGQAVHIVEKPVPFAINQLNYSVWARVEVANS